MMDEATGPGIHAAQARMLGAQLLERTLPYRWAHSLGVAAMAVELADLVGEDADLLHSAALLHDIGYAAELTLTGFHPVDGARYLRRAGGGERLAGLVAYHSFAEIEAAERGLLGPLDEFSRDPWLVDVLTYCDMLTAPDGERTTAVARIAEILERYPDGSLVARSVRLAEEKLLAAVQRIEQRLLERGNGH